MKKLLAIILTLAALTSALGAVAYADFGTGAAAVANEVKLIKTGLIGRKISFSDVDIKQGLCITDFDSIEICELPKTADGTLMLAGRRVGVGTTIKRKNIAALVFIPTSKDVTEASFKFKCKGYASDAEIEFMLKFTDAVNYEPEIPEEYAASLSQRTQREIGIHGKMYATDPEGDDIEFIIVSYPTEGALTMFNKNTGEYIYTPPTSYTGKDSFVYVARDEWGNYSTATEVSLTVSERMSEVKYIDMVNRREYNAAVAMTALGIMNGTVIGDGVYFNPDDTVTRAEFVAMAMKALGIKADSTLSSTYFDDNDDIPYPLVGYIATAQRTGIVRGSFEGGQLLFSPNEAITKYDAAVILASILGVNASGEISSFENESDIPVWARDSVYAMCEVGIFEYSESSFDAGEAVTRAECAEYLYKLIIEN